MVRGFLVFEVWSFWFSIRVFKVQGFGYGFHCSWFRVLWFSRYGFSGSLLRVFEVRGFGFFGFRGTRFLVLC